MTPSPLNPSCSRRSLLASAMLPFFAARAAGQPATGPKVLSIDTISRQPHLYHAWPTMIRRKSGELVAVYSGGREGHHCPFGRLEIIRSHDDGHTWSWPQVFMDTPIDDRDAGICETPRGTLLVTTFTAIGFEQYLANAKDWDPERIERWNAVMRTLSAEQRKALVGKWMLRSEDGGVTWTAPYRVPATTPHGPVCLADGRLLYLGKNDNGAIGLYQSPDDGLSWRQVCELPPRRGDQASLYHEPHLVEAADGTLIAHLRNHNPANERETLQSESTDGGRTWSEPHPIGVWGLPSHLICLRDGRLLMTYGYRRMPRGNHACLSTDHGRTWSPPIVISDDGTGDIGYPSTVELPNGELLTLWYESKYSGSVPVKLPPPPYSVLRLARWKLA
jgi:sialidase-1